MMDIFLLGASTPVGLTLKEIIYKNFPDLKLLINSRNNSEFQYIDLTKPSTYKLERFKNKLIIVSFSPIWYVSKFFEVLENKNKLSLIKALLVCSSTSATTKKFSNCDFDKKLVSKLCDSENSIIKICSTNKIILKIIRPTLIYTSPGSIFKDKNVSLITKFLKFSPFIILPKDTGLRQPIHVTQLASYIKTLIKNILEENISHFDTKIVELGGDSVISYKEMIMRIKNSYIKNYFLRFCLIITLPNRVFYFLMFPVNLINPRIFSAIMRINSNLSGFNKISYLLGIDSDEFPLEY